MVQQYYLLVKSYAEQDAVVLVCFAFALLVFLGWQLIQRFNYRWLNHIYVGEMLALWVGVLIYFGFIQS